MADKKTKEEEKEPSARFTQEQLTKSKKYADKKDVLNAVLQDGQAYTFEEVDAAIASFMKGKVE